MFQQTPTVLADLGCEFMSLQLGLSIFSSCNWVHMQLTSQTKAFLETSKIHRGWTTVCQFDQIFDCLNCTFLNSNWAPESSKSGHCSWTATDLLRTRMTVRAGLIGWCINVYPTFSHWPLVLNSSISLPSVYLWGPPLQRPLKSQGTSSMLHMASEIESAMWQIKESYFGYT